MREPGDFRRETPEPDENDRGLELLYSSPNDSQNDRGFEVLYSPPDDNQLTLPGPITPIPTEIPSDNSPGHETNNVSAPSPREAYLIRSYIQKIAAVVSLLSETEDKLS